MQFKPKFNLFRTIGIALAAVVGFSLAQCTPWWFPSAHAGEAVITWTAPTKNCDGTSLTDLTGYSLLYGQKRTDLPKVLTYTVTGLTPGPWFFSLAAVTPTDRSEFVTVEKVVAPEDFKTVETTAYVLVKRTGRILLVPAGTVPLGTVCNHLETVNGKYVVPSSSVTPTSNLKLDVVVATCQ